jgi:hypothetical protein
MPDRIFFISLIAVSCIDIASLILWMVFFRIKIKTKMETSIKMRIKI